MKIHIVDYDSGNLESIRNALTKVGCSHITTNNPKELRKAKAVIFPGQGSFPSALKKLHQYDITPCPPIIVYENKNLIITSTPIGNITLTPCH